jgi:formylglycine-generating enzyme required for sulfatase activity
MPSQVNDTALVILLGARAFPEAARNLPPSEAFSASHDAIKDYFLDSDGFGLSNPDNLLDLFDSPLNNTDMISRIADWLQHRSQTARSLGQAVTDLFIYYVGHGGLEDGSRDYYLAIRSTRQDDPYGYSLQLKRLARTLRNNARFFRRYLILDACFAGAALSALQGPLDQVIEQRVADVEWSSNQNPAKGTSLLCASSATDPAKVDSTYTMFSGALIRMLREGSPRFDDYMTFRQIQRSTADLIRRQFGDDGVHPELHSPDQTGQGDIADLPMFRNPLCQPAFKVLVPEKAISVRGVTYRYVPHSTGWIGSNDGYDHEQPRHQVALSSFFLQDTPVTNDEFDRFCDATGYKTSAELGAPGLYLVDRILLPQSRTDCARGRGLDPVEAGKGEHPTVHVSWHDAMAYCKWMSESTGFEVSLPHETQWEYPAAGPQGYRWPSGDSYEPGQANVNGQGTTPVRQFPPTSLDLYDMAGNVYEWCMDWYTADWMVAGHRLSGEPTHDPAGPGSGLYKILRGGSWYDCPKHCRCANRFQADPNLHAANWGFRTCLRLSDHLVERLMSDPDWRLPAFVMLGGGR